MDTIFLIILSAFAVYGLICAVYSVILWYIPIKDKYLIVQFDCSQEKTESLTRLLMKKYSDCEIIVINANPSEESSDIITALSEQYGQLHFANK